MIIRKKNPAVSFDFIIDVSEVQFFLFLTAEQTHGRYFSSHANARQLLKHSFKDALTPAFTVQVHTQTSKHIMYTHNQNSQSEEWTQLNPWSRMHLTLHPIYMTE